MKTLMLASATTALIAATLLSYAFSSMSCASVPPNLSPEASRAWYGTRVIQALDVLRDTAIDANAQTPPLLTEDVTRKIVQAHKSAITVVHDAPNDWNVIVQTSLTELERDLSSKDQALIHPYVALVLTILKEVKIG